METLLLLIDAAAMILVAYYSWKNDKLRQNAPEQGVFRMTGPVLEAPGKPKMRAQRRVRRL